MGWGDLSLSYWRCRWGGGGNLPFETLSSTTFKPYWCACIFPAETRSKFTSQRKYYTWENVEAKSSKECPSAKYPLKILNKKQTHRRHSKHMLSGDFECKCYICAEWAILNKVWWRTSSIKWMLTSDECSPLIRVMFTARRACSARCTRQW